MNCSVYIEENLSGFKESSLEGIVVFGIKELSILNKDIILDVVPMDGVWGHCYGEGDVWYIEIHSDLEWDETVTTIFHELAHIKQEEMTDSFLKEREAENAANRLFREYAELL